MISQSLLVAALAATAAATGSMNLHPAHQAVKRAVEARQTDSSGAAACASSLMSIASDMPTPPAALMSFAATNTQTDPCSITLPPDVESAISSYGQEAQSWFSENEDDFSSVIEDCPDVASIYSSASAAIEAAALPTCAGGSGDNGSSDNGGSNDDGSNDDGSNGDSSNGDGSNGDGSNDGSNDSNDSNTDGNDNEGGNNNGNDSGSDDSNGENAGARPTAFVGAAVAAAGFLGVVALL